MEFREYLVGTTLGYIGDLFHSADIPRGKSALVVSGARRSFVEEYYAAVDWTSPDDMKKILTVYEQILNRAEELSATDQYQAQHLKKLSGALRRDGYVYQDGRLVAVAGVDFRLLASTPAGVDRASVQDHIRRMDQSVESDPAQAIGSAKELLETVAKHILVQYGEDPDQDDNVPQLVRHAMKLLDLSLENLPQAKKGAESIRQVLAGLGQIVGGTAELRNLYGTGHGRTRTSGLQPRHARLVAGSVVTLARFLLDTLDARRTPTPPTA
jgi:hypothetical protein